MSRKATPPTPSPTRYRATVTRKTKDKLKAIEGVVVMEAYRFDEECDRWEIYFEAMELPTFMKEGCNLREARK